MVKRAYCSCRGPSTIPAHIHYNSSPGDLVTFLLFCVLTPVGTRYMHGALTNIQAKYSYTRDKNKCFKNLFLKNI